MLWLVQLAYLILALALPSFQPAICMCCWSYVFSSIPYPIHLGNALVGYPVFCYDKYNNNDFDRWFIYSWVQVYVLYYDLNLIFWIFIDFGIIPRDGVSWDRMLQVDVRTMWGSYNPVIIKGVGASAACAHVHVVIFWHLFLKHWVADVTGRFGKASYVKLGRFVRIYGVMMHTGAW